LEGGMRAAIGWRALGDFRFPMELTSKGLSFILRSNQFEKGGITNTTKDGAPPKKYTWKKQRRKRTVKKKKLLSGKRRKKRQKKGDREVQPRGFGRSGKKAY